MSENKKVLHRIEDVTESLSISRSTLYELIQSQQIKSVLIGRSRRIPASAIEEYVHRLLQEQMEEAR